LIGFPFSPVGTSRIVGQFLGFFFFPLFQQTFTESAEAVRMEVVVAICESKGIFQVKIKQANCALASRFVAICEAFPEKLN